ncbi:hypothetical protein QVN97_14425 [Bacteroides caecigallinarum]|nr:hypothetical protein [Bacteroides caecigallinarum]
MSRTIILSRVVFLPWQRRVTNKANRVAEIRSQHERKISANTVWPDRFEYLVKTLGNFAEK